MRIIITQAEIEEAIKTHVLKQITIANNQNVSVDFKNTRGEDGATAEINISAKPTPATETVKRTPAPKPTEQVSAAPTVEETEQVTETAETVAEPTMAETDTVVEVPDEVVVETATETDNAQVEVREPIKATAESVTLDGPDEVPAKPVGSLFASLKRPEN